MKNYLSSCVICTKVTSRTYATAHAGQCKACFSYESRVRAYEAMDITRSDAQGIVAAEDMRREKDTRTARIIDCGYLAYAIEEGHFSDGEPA